MTTPVVESPGLKDSSVSEPSWDDLPPADVVPDIAPAEARPDTVPGTCGKCGDPIVREPGARGRMPRYHPDCRPSSKTTGSAGGAGRRSTRADAEAIEACAAFEGLVVKAAIMVSMMDRYDAFCIMVGWQQTKPNFIAVLKRYSGFRKEMLALQSGGSIAALIISILMTLLPIAAHHGFIPGKTITQVLVNAPFTLHAIAQRLSEGAAGLTALMEEQLQAARDAAKPATVTTAPPPDDRINGARIHGGA